MHRIIFYRFHLVVTDRLPVDNHYGIGSLSNLSLAGFAGTLVARAFVRTPDGDRVRTCAELCAGDLLYLPGLVAQRIGQDGILGRFGCLGFFDCSQLS